MAGRLVAREWVDDVQPDVRFDGTGAATVSRWSIDALFDSVFEFI